MKVHLQDTIKQIKHKHEIYNKWIQKIPVKLEIIKDRNKLRVVALEVRESVKKILPKARNSQELVLSRETVKLVLKFICNVALSIERTPSAFSKLEEEDIRDILLSVLNSIFEGSASGETFSKIGKTDIYLNISKGQILICECKFWRGQKTYGSSINQLFDYLTWRENFGIIITLNKANINFSEIIKTAKVATCIHKTYITKSFGLIEETYFTTLHKFPQDDEKKVEIHHLFFNIFYEREK